MSIKITTKNTCTLQSWKLGVFKKGLYCKSFITVLYSSFQLVVPSGPIYLLFLKVASSWKQLNRKALIFQLLLDVQFLQDFSLLNQALKIFSGYHRLSLADVVRDKIRYSNNLHYYVQYHGTTTRYLQQWFLLNFILFLNCI